jgi:hypothetical protein
LIDDSLSVRTRRIANEIIKGGKSNKKNGWRNFYLISLKEAKMMILKNIWNSVKL